MKELLTILLACFTSISFTQQWDWTIISNRLNSQHTYSFGSSGSALTTDYLGNIFFGGQLSDSIALLDTILVSNSSQTELLVIKFSPLGTPLWIKHTGGNNNSSSVSGIEVDNYGNCFITGITNDTCYFDTIMVNANGGNPAYYIAKINPEGFFEWASVAGRSLFWALSLGCDLAISKNNEIYVTGSFLYEMDLQGIHLNSFGEDDIFIAKYDQNGYLKWIRQIGSIHRDISSSITVDSIGNCYVTGGIGDNSTFGQFILHTNNASSDGFVTKLDSTGNFLWAKNFGSNQSDRGNSIAYSPFGYISLTGQINGLAYFDDTTVQYNGGSDIFIARYDLEGNLSFVKGFGGPGNENVHSILINFLGNILVSGEFDGIGHFDTTHLYSSGYTDLFSAELDYEGNLDWIVQYGTPLKDYGNAIAIDAFDNVFVAGRINGQQGSVSQYYYSLFLGKIKNPVTPVELNFFNATVSENTIHLTWSTATEFNNRGFEVERSANKTDLPDGKAGWRLIGFEEGNGTTTEQHNYFFVDDLFGTSTHKLYYRLKQIDFDGSFEYSEIVQVVIAPTKFSLSQNYPNPFNPSTVINYQLPVSGEVTLKVYDVLGREVATLVNEEKNSGVYEVEFDASQLSSGIYYYQLKAGKFIETKKMILMK